MSLILIKNCDLCIDYYYNDDYNQEKINSKYI